MALSGSRLNTALATDILTQLQSQYPDPGNLTAGETTARAAAQQKLATAIAAAVGPDVVTEITGHAALAAGLVTSGAGAGGAVTGTVA